MRFAIWWIGRAASAAGTLLGVSVLIFAAVRFMPGGYAQIVLGPFATAGERAALAARYGLEDPLVVQYGRWIAAIGRGDFGTSLLSEEPVAAELVQRLPVTAELALLAAVAAILAGVPLGVLTAVRSRRGGGAAAGRLASGLGVSVPEFVLGSLLVFVFSRYALGLTVGGYVPLSADPGANLRAMALPATVLAVAATTAVARTTRDAVMNVLTEQYVTAAVARGETPWFIVRHHVLRNAAVPVVIVLTAITASLLGGALIVEFLFDLPGIGSYIVQAVGRRDYAVVQAGVLLAASVFILMNVIADFVVGVVDPRLGAAVRDGGA